MSSTGVRPSEALAMRLLDVNFDQGTAAVVNLKRSRSTRKPGRRIIEVPRATLDFVAEHITETNARLERFERNPLVFPSPKGTALDSNGIGKMMRRAGVHLEAAGLPAYIPYSFRHTFASLCLQEFRGADLQWIANQMGHRVDVLLSHYAHVIPASRDMGFADVMSHQPPGADDREIASLSERVAASQKAARGQQNTKAARSARASAAGRSGSESAAPRRPTR